MPSPDDRSVLSADSPVSLRAACPCFVPLVVRGRIFLASGALTVAFAACGRRRSRDPRFRRRRRSRRGRCGGSSRRTGGEARRSGSSWAGRRCMRRVRVRRSGAPGAGPGGPPVPDRLDHEAGHRDGHAAPRPVGEGSIRRSGRRLRARAGAGPEPVFLDGRAQRLPVGDDDRRARPRAGEPSRIPGRRPAGVARHRPSGRSKSLRSSTSRGRATSTRTSATPCSARRWSAPAASRSWNRRRRTSSPRSAWTRRSLLPGRGTLRPHRGGRFRRRGRNRWTSRPPAREHAGRGYKVPNGALYSTVGDPRGGSCGS